MEHTLHRPTLIPLNLYLGNRPLTFAGLFSITLILPTLVLIVIDQRVLDHEALWLKPLKFQISMAVLCLTLAASTLVLSTRVQHSLYIKIPAWAVSITAVYELVFLAIQAGRGTRSHFNSDTLFDQIAGALMAAGASILVSGAAIIGLVILVMWLAKGMAALRDPLMLSVALGLMIGGVLGGYTGSYIGMNGGPFVGSYLPNDPTLPLLGWSQTIGDLRISHFFGLHAMQALPAIAVATLTMTNRPIAVATTLAAAAGWTWLTLTTLYDAQLGLPAFFL